MAGALTVVLFLSLYLKSDAATGSGLAELVCMLKCFIHLVYTTEITSIFNASSASDLSCEQGTL